MKSRKTSILIALLILVAFVSTVVIVWIKDKQIEGKIAMQVKFIEIGMSEKEVFRIWGDPDEVILARSGERSSSHVIYSYNLESGEIVYVVFDPKLQRIEILGTDNSWTCLADISSGVGTQIQIDFLTGKYEVTKPNYSFLFENSPISAEHVCQLEVGMKDSLIQEVLGTPDKIIKNEPPIISVNYIYYLNDKYQLDITMLNDALSHMQLNGPKGNYVLSLLSASSEGARVSFDTNEGVFGTIYPANNLSPATNGELLQINNIKKGMKVDEVKAELDNYIINKTEVGISSNIYFLFYANNRSIDRITYELDQNAVLEMVFQDTLVLARMIQDNETYYLLSYVDPIGTQIHYDPETGYFSKTFQE